MLPSPSSRSPIVVGILLVVIVGVAVWFRIERIDRNSLFFDEIWHMELSTGRGSAHLRLPIDQLLPPQPNPVSLGGAPPWYAIWTHMDWVIHPPLYNISLRFWRMIFGQGVAAARAFSITFSILAIFVLFDVARRQFNSTAALWACALMAASVTNIAITQTVRGYTLLLLLVLIACWIILRIEESGLTKPRVIGLGLSTLAMMLTHYFAVGAVAGLLIYSIFRLPRAARRPSAIAIASALLLYAIAWGPTLLAQTSYIESSADIFLKEASEDHFIHLLRRLAALPCRMLLDAQLNVSMFEAICGCAIYAFIIVMLCISPLLNSKWLLWICLFLGNVLPILALDLRRNTVHLEYMQYTFVASPAIIMMLASVAGTAYPLLARHGAPASILLLCLFNHDQAYPINKPDLRPMCAYLDSLAKDDEPIVFLSVNPQGRDGQSWFLASAIYSHVLPRRVACLTHPPDQAFLDQLPADKKIVLLAPFTVAPGQAILPGYTVEKQQDFPDAGSCLLLRR